MTLIHTITIRRHAQRVAHTRYDLMCWFNFDYYYYSTPIMHQSVQFTIWQLLLSDITIDMVIAAVRVVMQEDADEKLNVIHAYFHVRGKKKKEKEIKCSSVIHSY